MGQTVMASTSLEKEEEFGNAEVRKVMSELDLSCALSVKKLLLSTLRNDVDFCQRKDFFKKKEGSFA